MHKYLAVVVLLAAALPAQGQSTADYTNAVLDWSLKPNHGLISLEAGFTPTPYVRGARTGGYVDVSSDVPECSGYASVAPDFDLNYAAADATLQIQASAEEAVALIVHAPDGVWYCGEKSGDAPHPRVTFAKPETGQYHIWIASLHAGRRTDAVLTVSEIGD